MAFLEELPEKAKEFAGAATEKVRELADAAAEKTKEAVDSAKVTAAVVAEQRALERSCRTIGEWYLSQLEGEAPEAVADLVAAARAFSKLAMICPVNVAEIISRSSQGIRAL